MPVNILCVAFSVIGGFLISLANYNISKYFYTKKETIFILSVFFRQILSVGWLVACFFAGREFNVLTATLLGGAAGVTLPSFFFTGRIIKLSEKNKSNRLGEENDKND